jgi:diguanylate cyclase (GGDEF)-like protein
MMSSQNPELEAALAKLRQEYISELPGRFAELRKDLAALRVGEDDAAISLKHRLHQLAGSGGSHGLPTLSVLARGLELWLAEEPEWDDAALAHLETELDRLIAEFDSVSESIDLEPRRPEFGWQARVVGTPGEIADAVARTLTTSGFLVSMGEDPEDIGAIPFSARPDLLAIVGGATDFDTHATAAAWSSNRAMRPRGVVLIDTGSETNHLGAVAAGVDAIFDPEQIHTDLPRYAKTLGRIGVPPSSVLLVEDDLPQAQVVASALEASNIRVTHAEDAASAERLLAQETPDLVLMDVHLPDVDGFTLARLIRQDPRYSLLPIVFLTARGSTAAQIEALRAGGDDFLSKPIDQGLGLLLQVVITRAERGRRIREMVHKDGLTGLLNHATLMAELHNATEYAHRNQEQFAFLMVDIDHFKRVNDRHGHLVGDQVLLHVANVFQNASRASDLIGRYGGEEFGIILRGNEREAAGKVAEKLRQALRDRPAVTRDGEQVPIQVSIGVAIYPKDGATASDLTHAADLALYRAKSTGRNRVNFADEVEG